MPTERSATRTSSQETQEKTAKTTPTHQRTLPGVNPLALVAVYILLAVLPLILSALQGIPSRGFFHEVSSALVMIGFVMLLVQFVLSGRFKQVSGQIGIDVTMRFHQLVARSVLLFIVLHPLLYAAPEIVLQPAEGVAQLNRMFASDGLRTGVIAWWLLIIVVALAIFRDRLPFGYEAWRLSHAVGALAIALLSLNHTLAVGTYAEGRVLAGFWVVLTAVAVLTLAYVYLVKPLLQLREPYTVVGNEKVADRTWEVTVEPQKGEAIDFAPGQFVWLNLGHSPFSLVEHPFSISSAPADRPRIAFTIKENGDFTNRIGEIAAGTRAYLDGPHGFFTPAGRPPTGMVFIAGGVGFAPIMGMLRQFHAERYDKPLRLIYGNRVESQILYRAETQAIAETLDLKVHHVLTEPPEGWQGLVGELSADVLEQCLSDADRRNWLYFVCGPSPMLTSAEATLRNLGVPAERIVYERFTYD